MTATPEPPEDAAAGRVATAQADTIGRPLLVYRILAWTTGVLLIALCYEMVVKYVLRVEDLPYWLLMVPFVHGWVYFAYLLAAANLAVKVRWPLPTTILTLLAGTIPVAGVVVEHFRTREIKQRFGL